MLAAFSVSILKNCFALNKEKSLGTKSSKALAEREGFVLDFCSTFRIGFYVTFRKNLRSPFTKQLTGLFCSLRSNPIYILGKAKTERLLVSRLALAEREGFEPSCACAQTDFEKSGRCHNPSLCVPNFLKIHRFFRFSSAHL